MNRFLFILPLIILSCTTTGEEGVNFTFFDLKSGVYKEIDVEGELVGYKVILEISGEISQPGSIVISNSERVINTYFLPGGKIDRVIKSDWYDRSIKIEFKSRVLNSGTLNFNTIFL